MNHPSVVFIRKILLGFSMLLFVSCDVMSLTPVENGNKEQILHIGNGSDPSDLDPHITTGIPEYNIHTSLFEGLLSCHPETLKPMPGNAESWEISEDYLTYTFHLRKDAQWSNGDPITAKDYLFSYKRVLSPKLGAEYAYMLFLVENAKRYYEGDISDFSKVGFEAPDDYTLKIRLEAHTPYFPSMLTHNIWFPVHAPTIFKYGAMDERGLKWTRAGRHVGNGPFKLKKWNLNDVVSVVKNEHYWDAENVRLNQINFYAIEDVNVEERSFRAGQLHVTESIPSHKIEKYQSTESPYLQIHPYLGTYYYLFNVSKEPVDDIRVRRALSLAIDRDIIVKQITRGGQLPAHNFTPPNTAGYFSSIYCTENIDMAQKLLAKAGYPNGEGFPKLKLLYNTSELHQPIAETIQEMWRKNLNIEIVLENQEWKSYLETRRQGDFQIARAGWIGDYNDPTTFLDIWKSDSGNNHALWKNERYDNLLQQASITYDPYRRFGILRKAEYILMTELPIIPIYFYVSASLVQTGVRNWHPNILNHRVYKNVYLEP